MWWSSSGTTGGSACSPSPTPISSRTSTATSASTSFRPVLPERLLDARVDLGSAGGQPHAGQTVALQVTGAGDEGSCRRQCSRADRHRRRSGDCRFRDGVAMRRSPPGRVEPQPGWGRDGTEPGRREDRARRQGMPVHPVARMAAMTGCGIPRSMHPKPRSGSGSDRRDIAVTQFVRALGYSKPSLRAVDRRGTVRHCQQCQRRQR